VYLQNIGLKIKPPLRPSILRLAESSLQSGKPQGLLMTSLNMEKANQQLELEIKVILE
jgi:hypothetical protein